MREWFRVWNWYGLSCKMSAKNVIIIGRFPYDCNVKIYLIECNNCGMTTLGRINIKLCGGGPTACCGIVDLGTYGNFQQGSIHQFEGAELQTCNNYHLTNIDNIEEFELTVYHEGSNAVMFDWIEIISTSHRVRCPEGIFMEGDSMYTSPYCFLE